MNNRHTKYAIGLDLGGTFLKYAVVSSAGEVLFEGRVPSKAEQSAEAVLETIFSAIDLCRKAASGVDLAGVGVGTPGIIADDSSTVLGGAENIVGWENIPLGELISGRTGLNAKAVNDANAMALAETLFGAAKGSTDVVFLTIGTGIGGGVMIGGKLYGGYRNRGTELGHITINSDGPRCACGSVGCLEYYASTSALVRRFEELVARAGIRYDHVDGRTVVNRFLSGDEVAVKVMEEHWDYLAAGITSLIHIFSPQKIVIGGGISEAGAFYIENIERRVRERAMPCCGSETLFAAAALGNRAGCMGAAGLLFV